MDSANVRIKDSWKNLNNELVKFGKKEFKQITNEFDHLVRSINSELSELQYNIKDFSKNANMLGNFDGQD